MARTPAPGTAEHIQATASRLFYAHGVRAVGLQRVIDEAGTGKSLLYQHFPAKSALVAGYLRQAWARRAAVSRRARDAAPDDPRSQLLALVEEVAATAAAPGFRGCPFRNYLAEFPDDADGPPAAVARGYLAESRAEVDALVARLGVDDPEALAERLWLLLDGIYLQAYYRDGAPGAAAAVALARELMA